MKLPAFYINVFRPCFYALIFYDKLYDCKGDGNEWRHQKTADLQEASARLGISGPLAITGCALGVSIGDAWSK